MPFYRCEIINQEGKKETRIIKAEDENMLKATIRLEKCFLVKSSLSKEKKPNTFLAVSSKVKPNEILMFLREFSVLIHSGATIIDSLYVLKNQNFSKVFQKIIQEIYYDVLSGVLLSESLKKHRKVFPDYFISMVAIGEASGSMDKVLSSLADYYENDRKIKNKAKTALVYPIFLLVLILVVIAFLVFFILPQFQEMIDELGGKVPLLTRIVMDIASFIKDNILLILLVLGLIVFGLVLFFHTKPGKVTKDYLGLHLPFIGKIKKNLITTRFSRAFLILLENGMNIMDCLKNLTHMLSSPLLEKRFRKAMDDIDGGKEIHLALEETKIFPYMLTQMLSVGEKSGNIPAVLKSSTSYFDQQVENSIAKATTAMEPILIISLGVIVGIVILSVFLPMIELYQSIL
mgnify:CR=1 FL=1